MKKLNKKFWGTFRKNDAYGNSIDFENWIDEFVRISEFEDMSELSSIFVIERFVFKGFEDGKKCKLVLLEDKDNFDYIVTSDDYFTENKIELLNEIIVKSGTTTTRKGIEPIYELIDIEVLR